ncbi:uncharacterized protein KGF55_002222 [Candida pseudojiufengensis]|uniref:uncharacterized protein n=1 Tax=Candida pseudojiufengensis TaxID=497109 RepID=UPI002225B222|nr:uncharacterized protein KGF55_002222 [Candida pseudojiufengensis]KAI5964280.1 hypothetical protein KGF55_002222 [Candida pseudojiufengensis]
MSNKDEHQQMQIKILYSFDDNATTFLCRSTQQFAVQTVEVPIQYSINDEPEIITLGAFELKDCIKQLLQTNPENFKLHSEDYALYYKDITEQPDEPFVSNGVLSKLLSSNDSCLIPGRVCQNVSANFLFGNKSNISSLTLEIRLKLHTIEATPIKQLPPKQPNQQQRQPLSTINTSQMERKRPYESIHKSSNSVPAAKATRTLSLPLYSNIQNIQQADKTSARYNRENVENRFKSAPFYQEKVVDKNERKQQKNYSNQSPSQSTMKSQLLPQRAVRTRSMLTTTPLVISSPINEENYSSDDPEYRVGNNTNEENVQEEDDEEEGTESQADTTSPYTPQQPPYIPDNNDNNDSKDTPPEDSNDDNDSKDTPPELPEDLDSKRTHTIPNAKLPKNHGLVCINRCCQTQTSIAWKYFELEVNTQISQLIRAKEFDKKNYEGMLGPLCNACFLFYKNKGFMRPEHVVKKYNQQQKYTQKIKLKSTNNAKEDDTIRNSLNSIASARKNNHHHHQTSSPATFPTPSHTPSAINQVIQNKYHNNNNNNHYNQSNSNSIPSGQTPDYHDLLNQLNVYGGPSTDIDPLPNATPPMIATKSNTRVINLEETDERKATRLNTKIIPIFNEEDKENQPPPINLTNASATNTLNEFDAILQSIHEDSDSNWMNFLTQPSSSSQIKHETSPNSKTPVDQLQNLITTKKKNNNNSPDSSKSSLVNNMPSSPYLSNHLNLNDEESNELNDELSQLVNSEFKINMNQQSQDPQQQNKSRQHLNSSSPNTASRNNTTNSLLNWQSHNTINKDLGSTPNTDFFSNDDLHNDDNNEMINNNNNNNNGSKHKGYSSNVDLSKKSIHT